MNAEILCIGTEILLGDIINTNGAFLARELAALGIDIYHQTVVGDNPERLTKSLELALSRADMVKNDRRSWTDLRRSYKENYSRLLWSWSGASSARLSKK